MGAVDPRQVANAFGAILRTVRIDAAITKEVLWERADCDCTYRWLRDADYDSRPSTS
jgi:hypothetical protein